MPSLIQGRIVYPLVPVPDPQGNNPKTGRGFVVLNRPAGLKSGETLKLVGITSEYYAQDAINLVALPFGLQASTRLSKQSWALCTWVVKRTRSEVEISQGFVRGSQLFEIAARVSALGL